MPSRKAGMEAVIITNYRYPKFYIADIVLACAQLYTVMSPDE